MIIKFLKRTPSPHDPTKFWEPGDRRVIEPFLALPWIGSGNAIEVNYLFEEDEPTVIKQAETKLKRKKNGN